MPLTVGKSYRCYTRFNNLAHRPRGTEATYPVMVYELDPVITDGGCVAIMFPHHSSHRQETGSLMLLSAYEQTGGKEVMNPAFFR